MRSITRLLAVAGTIVALTVLAPVASAGSQHAFHMDKTCAEDLSEPLGYVCTVQHSDFRWIPAGTDIHYTSRTRLAMSCRPRSQSRTAAPMVPASGAAP